MGRDVPGAAHRSVGAYKQGHFRATVGTALGASPRTHVLLVTATSPRPVGRRDRFLPAGRRTPATSVAADASRREGCMEQTSSQTQHASEDGTDEHAQWAADVAIWFGLTGT